MALALLSSAALASEWTDRGDRPGVVTRRDEAGRATRAFFDAGDADGGPTAHLVAANWRALGPFGGDIADVQASPTNPSIVLAGLAPASGANGGLYRSSDGGASWSSVAALSGHLVHDVEFAPDGTAYLGTLDGVWKSTDGGVTWTAENLGIGLNDEVLDVTIDPANPLRVWAGIADALGNQSVNVMLSIDGGVTWTNKTPPLASPISCSTIAIDPTNANKVYTGFAGFGGGGQVWVSTNGGTSWTNRSAGLPNRPVNDLVHTGTRLLVGGGQLFGSQTFGVFSSIDDGVTWTALHDGTWPNLVVQDIAVDPNNANVIYAATAGAGLFRSTNGGTSWSFGVGGTGSLSVNSVRFAPGSSTTLYTGSSSNAVWKSTDAGASFAPSSNGIGALDVFSVAANPQNASELAIAFQGLNDGGVYTSTNGGTTWTLAAAPGTRWNHVRFSPAGVLYAFSDGPTTIAPEALYRRTGTSWTSIGPDQGTLFESELYSLRVSANDPNLILACGQDFGVAGFEPTVWRTTNGGTTWTKVHEGAVANKPLEDLWLVDPAADTTFVAAQVDFTGSNQGGALRSTNGGVTWAPSNTGLPSAIQSYSLCGSPSSTSTLFLANGYFSGTQGVWKSVDAGASWTATGSIGPVQEIVCDAFDPQVIFVAPQSGTVRVRVSTDGGVMFSAYDTNLGGSGFVRDLQRSSASLLDASSTGTYATDVPPPFTSYCAGDGSGTACPCGNASPLGSGAGCLNSLGSGAKLAASGSPHVSADTVVLTASGLPATAPALFFQGTAQSAGGAGAVFGDGLRCAAGTVVRLGTHAATSGVAAYPVGADPAISVRGSVPPAGATRHYQAWYRNAAAFCTASTFNLTNGLSIAWDS